MNIIILIVAASILGIIVVCLIAAVAQNATHFSDLSRRVKDAVTSALDMHFEDGMRLVKNQPEVNNDSPGN